MQKWPHSLYLLSGASILVVGFALGIFLGRLSNNPINPELRIDTIIRSNQTDFPLIKPLLLGADADESKLPQYILLKNNLAGLIKQEALQKTASAVSIYFRDLNSGEWTGINEDEKYTPASLLKIPLMIAYYKTSEADPQILNREYFYDGSFNANTLEHFKPINTIKPGNYYTVEELVQRMIEDSDNNATIILDIHADKYILNGILNDLGLPTQNYQLDSVSPKLYSRIFRLLYNSTYLDNYLSEKALEHLSAIDFRGGIAAGIPNNITVATKFGERGVDAANADYSRELNECGIVYYPNAPYILCVMTKGTNLDLLADLIKDVSHTTYSAVENQKTENTNASN